MDEFVAPLKTKGMAAGATEITVEVLASDQIVNSETTPVTLR